MNRMTGAQVSDPVTRRPADEHGHAAGRAAPDDVLRGAALEPQRVDEHVEEDRDDAESAAASQLTRNPSPRSTATPSDPREHQGLAVGQLAGDERAGAGPLHQAVDVAVDVAVEGRRRPGADIAPPSSVQKTSHRSGTPRWARNIVGAVVTSSSSMTRGFVSETYARTLRDSGDRGRSVSGRVTVAVGKGTSVCSHQLAHSVDDCGGVRACADPECPRVPISLRDGSAATMPRSASRRDPELDTPGRRSTATRS